MEHREIPLVSPLERGLKGCVAHVILSAAKNLGQGRGPIL